MSNKNAIIKRFFDLYIGNIFNLSLSENDSLRNQTRCLLVVCWKIYVPCQTSCSFYLLLLVANSHFELFKNSSVSSPVYQHLEIVKKRYLCKKCNFLHIYFLIPCFHFLDVRLFENIKRNQISYSVRVTDCLTIILNNDIIQLKSIMICFVS